MSITKYLIRLDVEIDLDAEKPETIGAAGEFMASLSKGDFIEVPTALDHCVRVSAGKPKIVNKRVEAAE